MAEKVICYDLEGNPIEVSRDKLIFRPSVYGVAIESNKVLLVKQWDGYDFPGGAIEKGETLRDGLVREYKEETGLEVGVGKVIDCGDSMFKFPYREGFYHTVLIYFKVKIMGGNLGDMNLDENEKDFAGGPEWISLDKIEDIKFQNAMDSPALVRKALNK